MADITQLNVPYPSRDGMVQVRAATKDAHGKPIQLGDLTREWDTYFLARDSRQNLTPFVVPAGSAQETSQNAAIAITTIGGDLVEGFYRINSYVQIVTPDAVANSVQVAISYTFGGVSQTETFAAVTGITTGTHQGIVFPFMVDAGTPVSYTVTYASNTPNACVYSVFLQLELVIASS